VSFLLALALTWSPVAPRAAIHPPAIAHAIHVSRDVPMPGVSLSGIASWGYGWSGVVTRLPRGTQITVTGPLGSWSGRSVGYGPAVWTDRIADLSRSVFELICGDPRMGLCKVTVSY